MTDDGIIINMFFDRNEDAASEANKKYGAQLYKIAYNILKNASDAEECVNDALLAAWDSIPPNTPRTYLFAYLARLVRHIGLDRIRSGKSKKRFALFTELSAELESCLPAAADTEDEFFAAELSKAISDFLRTLSAQKRGLFIRRYFFADSVEETAKRFNMTQSNVKTTLFRLRRSLKAFLERRGYTI